MSSFFASRRRKKVLEKPFPAEWLPHLRDNVGHYGLLTPQEQIRLRDDLRIFIVEKDWEGAGGLSVTDEMKATIAAQACLLQLGFENDYFPNVQSVVIYPAGFVVPVRDRLEGGGVLEGRADVIGQAARAGPVILSWDDTLTGGRSENDGHNVVLHEFAHKLDMADGWVDGVPYLHKDQEVDDYFTVMNAEYRALRATDGRDPAGVVDRYAATNPGEFFAVCTELFFQKPIRLRDTHPDLYRVLKEYYRQETAARMELAPVL